MSRKKYKDIKDKYSSPLDIIDAEMFNDVLYLINYAELLETYITMEQEQIELRKAASEIKTATWN